MTEKNSSYKLDFSYKTKFSHQAQEEKYNLQEIITFQKHWRKNFNCFLRDIAKEYLDNGKEVEFWADAHSAPEVLVTQDRESVEDFKKALTVPGILFDESLRYANGISWIGYSLLNRAAIHCAKQTQEFKKAQLAFDKWLKRRSGVEKAWKLYAEENNNTPNRYSYQQQSKLSLTCSLEELAEHRSSKMFRKHLETNRPGKFYPGMVVKLKDEYLDKRGKDPLYYCYDPELKKVERVGTIVEQKNELMYGSIGEGSRILTVCWFVNGEETKVMERCLELHEV